MRKSQNIRTYAFLPHDLPMKFSLILPFLTRFRKKKRVVALQLDLRRNATRCTPIIAEANQNFKCFSSQILVPALVCAFANVAFAICTFFAMSIAPFFGSHNTYHTLRRKATDSSKEIEIFFKMLLLVGTK